MGKFVRLFAAAAALVALSAAPANAQSAKGRCLQELGRMQLISGAVNPGTANIVAGTEGDDDLSAAAI